MSMRHLTLGLLALSLAGCTNLSPGQLNQASKLLAQFGLSLKTVNAETGEEETLDKGDIKSVKDDVGNPIDYSFDSSGKMVFRPNKAGKQQVTVELQDGTKRQFELEGKEGDSPIEGEVGFIPDAGGQNVSSEVAIGGKVDVVQKQREQQQQFADRRVRLTFGGGGLEGLKPETLAAVFFDLNQLPYGAVQVEPDGTLKMAPEVFFMVKDYKEKTGRFPTLAVAFKRPDLGKVEVVKAELDELPDLPGIDPRQGNVLLKPEMFKTGQEIDLTVISEAYSTSFDQYKRDNGLMGPVYGGGQEIKPLPPEQQAAQQQQQQARTILLKFVRPGLQANAIKHVVISRYLAPMDAQAIVSVGDQGIAFRPEFIFGVAMARKTLLNNLEFPWVRVVYFDGGALKSWKFRLKQAPGWFSNLDRFTGPMPLVPNGQLPPQAPWIQPGFQWPPFELMGPSPVIEGSLVESTDPVTVTEEGLKQELESSNLRNP